MSEFRVEDLRRIRVEPGDVFVLTVARSVSAYEAQRMREAWREAVGPGVPLLVLGGGAQLTTFRPVPSDPVTELEVSGGTVEFPAELGVTAEQAETFRKAFEERREQSQDGGA